MPTLIIDTCLHGCTAVLADRDRVIASRSEMIGVGHAEKLTPLVADLFEHADATFADLNTVAATVGPGSFMGVRVGISFAKGIASARRIPTVPIQTLAAVRETASSPPQTVIVDARRDQVYAQDFANEPSAPVLISIEDAQLRYSDLSASDCAGSGVGLVFPGQGESEVVVPSPLGLFRAWQRAEPGRLAPAYLRAPDAKPPSRR